ncbi:Peptidase family M23 [Cyclonatronum proteinivorum]|uniref:Peptidase family M23 n=2 Tax=Cyclonatronum proteinivorum TaxID=1457365 RepID=A0A345UIC9_9BACT|nr:Peptidase family M23 [Cyclonatronum proteinivorum]
MRYSELLPLPRISLESGYSRFQETDVISGAGGYLEFRRGMYTSELFGGERIVHMGIDIWAPAHEPVFAFADGRIWGFRDNNNALDYGPTIITEHKLGTYKMYALYGHLSRKSLEGLKAGMPVSAGQRLGWLGDKTENGGWIPHLHFQLSREEPELPDMPGVVAPQDLEAAAARYPDPRMVLGPVYV